MSKSNKYGDGVEIEATPEQRAEHYRTQPRKAVPISQIKAEYPNPILAATGKGNGAVLTAANICLLAGEGGIAKSALTISLALAYAWAGVEDPDNPRMKPLTGGIFEGIGGRVMMVNYEDTPGTLSAKMTKLATRWGVPETALDNVFVQNLIGKPLYTTTNGITRDEHADVWEMFIDDGWDQLWREIDAMKPSLVILDPCLSAFLGNQNDPGEVRYFLMSVAERAQFSGHDMGVLMVAHSNKDARGKKEADPYEPGKVSGTTQWTDSVRGVMTIDWHPDKENRPSERILRIPKANLGRSRICCELDTIRADSGEILGFGTRDEWTDKEPQTRGENNGELQKEKFQSSFGERA